MTEQEKTDWAAALRSGEFYQYEGSLMDRRSTADKLSLCCIGVKAIKELGESKFRGIVSVSPETMDDAYKASNLTPREQGFFIRLNDNEHFTFEEIAQVIENVPESEWH